MKDTDISNFVNELAESNSDILLVSSINYERRSLEWLRIVKKILFQNKTPKHLHLYRLSLENPGQMITILGEKEHSQEMDFEEQIDLFQERIESEKINIKLSHSIKKLLLGELPDPSWMTNDLQKRSGLTRQFRIIFDITALPRRVMLLMMEAFAILIEQKKAQELFILYTWPLRYPLAGRSTNTGALRVEGLKIPLQDFLEDVNEIHGIMTAGRDGSIGRLFLESMPTQTKIDTFFHVKKDDYLYALDNMYENSNVLSYIEKNPSATVNYYLSVSSGYDAIINKIKSILREWNYDENANHSKALLIAPFGPKPMVITAFIGVRYSGLFFTKNNLNCKTGLVHVTSLQQNDLYSIGSRETSCYKIEIDDLLGR